MNRNVIVALIAFIVLSGGAYLYMQSKQNTVHPVDQSHRSYKIEVVSSTENIKPDRPATFVYKIKNDRDEILKNYEIVHEKIMHFIVIRHDLQHFQHLHPNFNQSTGEFSVDINFPTDGPFRVFPDFTPATENPQKLPVTLFYDINVGDINKYQAEPVIPDTQNKKSFGEYQVTYNLPSLVKQQQITYSLNIERNAHPVTDLQSYLGALGHSVILKMGTLDLIHTHAGELGHGMEHGSVSGTGPNIEFSTTFPELGVYKIFTQFQHVGEVITTDYVIKVD